MELERDPDETLDETMHALTVPESSKEPHSDAGSADKVDGIGRPQRSSDNRIPVWGFSVFPVRQQTR